MSLARNTATALLLVTILVAGMTGGAMAQASDLPQLGPRAAPTAHVQVESLPVMDPTAGFDPARATARYLAQVNGAARARSDAYFTGGYWFQLANLIYALAVAGLLLGTGTSARIQDWAQARTPRRFYQVMLYAAAYVPITVAATFPLSLYEGFFREHSYGLSTQNIWQWLGDFGIQFALTFAASVVFLPVLYIAIRRARETWWLWAAGLAIAFQILTIAIWPVFISPLFNHYSPLPEGPLKNRILALARANAVPVDNVWLVDASRQSSRVSANVSGFMGTARISLNDNLLAQGSPDEVLAVMGHEIGHYAMGHVTREILMDGLVTVAGFLFIHWGFVFACELFGGQWQVRRIGEVAGLPLIVALGSIFLFLATPLTNSISRTTEYQADIFGLNAVRKPDAFASVMLKLSTYRKLEPGKWEEMILYDHPSGRTRIATAMRWKKEHIGDPDLRETANLP
jgi:STE24 endopeptidase